MFALLGLSSAALVGIADFLAGLRVRDRDGFVVALLVQAGGLSVIVPLALIHGLDGGTEVIAAGAAAGLLSVAALPVLYEALAVGPMSVTAPIASTGVVVPVIVGLSSGEVPSSVTLAGMATAGAGVIVASSVAENDANVRARPRRGILFALLAAVLTGSTLAVVGDAASDVDVVSLVTYTRVVAVAGLLIVVAGRARRRHMWSVDVDMRMAMVGVLEAAGIVLYGLAAANGPLEVVAVLASLYPLVTVVLARLVLHERVRAIQAVGAALAIVGVVLISVG